MKVAAIYLDGQIIYRGSQSPVHEWKKERRLDLTSRLSPGVHELYIAGQNQVVYNLLCKFIRA